MIKAVMPEVLLLLFFHINFAQTKKTIYWFSTTDVILLLHVTLFTVVIKKPLTCRTISGREIWYLTRVPCAWKTSPTTPKYNRGKISEKKRILSGNRYSFACGTFFKLFYHFVLVHQLDGIGNTSQ